MNDENILKTLQKILERFFIEKTLELIPAIRYIFFVFEACHIYKIPGKTKKDTAAIGAIQTVCH